MNSILRHRDEASTEPRGGSGLEVVDDFDRLDNQLAEPKRRIAQAVVASKTTLVDVFGIGPIIAAMCISFTGDIQRFPSADRYAAYTGTAPIEVSAAAKSLG